VGRKQGFRRLHPKSIDNPETFPSIRPHTGVQLTMPILEYALTRPVVLSRWVTVSIVAAWVFWSIFVTLVNIVAVGYESVTISSTNFNNTDRNWYEKIIPSTSLIPESWNCSYSVIKVNEGSSPRSSHFDISCVF